MAEKKNKFALYMGTAIATRKSILSENFRSKIDNGEAKTLKPRHTDDHDFDAYFLLSREKAPTWINILDSVFEAPDFKRKSPASVVVFEVNGRVFAATFGYGSKLLDDRNTESDFGIKVAINTVADDALKAVQKSNVADAIQQFAQSAFKSRFGTFGGQNKFEILRRVSGSSDEDSFESVVGATGLSLTTKLSLNEIREIASKSLNLYNSDNYKNTDFSVIDDFKPVYRADEVDDVNEALIENLKIEESTFELCTPQLNFDDRGYIKITGAGLKGEHPDISLDLYKNALGENINHIDIDDLQNDRIRLFNDTHEFIGNWSVYHCLIGGLEYKNRRYVINEGKWYIPSDGISNLVDEYFKERVGKIDSNLDSFLIANWKKSVGSKGKTKNVPVYEKEEDYNIRISEKSDYVLFDQKWHKSQDGAFSKLEVCDLYDPENLRFIHIKRTSRRPSMVSYLFEQGHRAAVLWQKDEVRAQFIEHVRQNSGDANAAKLAAASPKNITIEYAIADYANKKGIIPLKQVSDRCAGRNERSGLSSSSKRIQEYLYRLSA